MVHAGSNQGFIPNALLVFKSNQTTGDYHHDMNNMNFEKWLVDKLIPNLPPNIQNPQEDSSISDDRPLADLRQSKGRS